ncbi:MAG: UvrD-helicase domain-containing protein, partial [Anaerolineaceae bacterium]|nr:UvrD-helicase domain-containing protein [Anaerolineaceae bacterium]
MGKKTCAILRELSDNQKEAARKIDCDVIVRAGAGSGKTMTLVARFLLLLDENRTWHPSDITAVTFTRKAAREMQSRIRTQMMDLAVLSETDPEEKQYWLQMLNEMDSANIGTIHSLCGRILRSHPAEAGLDPAFSILDDNMAAMLRGQITAETISRISSDPGYETLLDFYNGNRLSGILADMLKNREKTDKAMSVPGMDTEKYLRRQAEAFFFNSEYSEYIDEYRSTAGDPDFQKKNKAFAGRLTGLIDAYDEACAALGTDQHPADILNSFHGSYAGWTIRERPDGCHSGALKIRTDLRNSFPFVVRDPAHPERDITWYREFWKQCDEAEQSLRKLWPELRKAYMEMLDSSQEIDFDAMESLTLDLLRTFP